MIATSIKQSKRLLDAGLDPESADMCYANIELAPHYPRNLKLSARGYTETLEIFTETGFTKADVFPAWSLSRLIELCPDQVFWRIARARGHNIEGIFEDMTHYLCLRTEDERRLWRATL